MYVVPFALWLQIETRADAAPSCQRDHRRPDDVVLNPQARARVDAHGNRIYSVFPISKIYRSVHLQALFGTVDPGVDYSHKTVLDQWPGWFMVQLLNDIHLTKMFWSSLWNWEE